MEAIIDSTDAPGLLNALDANNVAFWVPYGQSDGGRFRGDDDCAWAVTGIHLGMYNSFARCRLADGAWQNEFDAFMHELRDRNLPAMWWVGPDSRPGDLQDRLVENGWKDAGQVPMMAADLDWVVGPPNQVAGLCVERIHMPEEQRLWAEVMNKGMGFRDEIVEAAAGVEATLSGPCYEAQHRFLGRLDGVPVAASLMLPGSGVAGIYAVATLPEARRRGIGAAMTVEAMQAGRRLGYKVATLSASSMGRPIYARLGFRQVCDYPLYSWSPGP